MKKPATWQFLVAALLFMTVGAGVTYWVQTMKLKAQFAAWVPARPMGVEALPPGIGELEAAIVAGDPSAVGKLGEAYRAAGFAEPARTAFVTMHNMDPADPMWSLRAAEMEIVLGRPKDAERRVKLLRVAGLPDGASYRMLGRLSEALGEQVDAKGDYERAVELDPTLDETWLRLITLYRAIGDTGAARRASVAGLEASPDSIPLRMDRGAQARGRGQWKQAEADFAHVVALAPDEAVAAHALAQVYFQTERHDQGEALLQAVLAKNPRDKTALMLLCVEALVAGDRGAVDAWYRRLQSLPDFSTTDRGRIAEVYRQEFGESPPELP